MSASSVTGRGTGAANNKTNKELSILTHGHTIVAAGKIHAVTNNTSPPTPGGVIQFPKPLPGNYATNYVVQVTPIGATSAYIFGFFENSAGDFTGFGVNVSSECDVMYSVIRIGAQVA